MKYLLFLILIFLGFVAPAQKQSEAVDTSYVLISSIEQSCKNIIFTDSMFVAWNVASVENIKSSLLKRSNDYLKWIMPLYKKGDNYRLSFCKVLNDDSLITREDFKKGFFIIEETIGDNGSHNRFLLTCSSGGNFKMVSYHFKIKDLAWYSSKETKVLQKNKFYKFYNRIKKQNEWEIIRGNLVVTKFTKDKITSYVFAGKGSRKGINQFYELIGRNQ